MTSTLVHRLLAESVGTALLVLVGAGSVVATITMDGEVSYASLGFIAFAFAFVVALVIYGFGPVSGAHINPAVTLSLAVTRRFPWAEVTPYILAQLVGSVVGAALIVAIYGTDAADVGVGATTLAAGVPYWQGIVAEALGTFVLLYAVMALAVDSRAPLGWAGLMIGLAVAAAILLIAPQTGGSLNPARTFGPYLAATVFGGDIPWSDLGVYVIGPVVGAIPAVLVYDFIAQTRPEERSASEKSFAPDSSEEA